MNYLILFMFRFTLSLVTRGELRGALHSFRISRYIRSKLKNAQTNINCNEYLLSMCCMHVRIRFYIEFSLQNYVRV